MENRQPTYPGRVILTPVPGQENTYDMIRADEPTVEGTPLNKATLLQDATCALLEIPNTSVPNDAFAKLALGIGKYGYVIQVQFTDGQPVEGATITGANAPDGGEAVTDANGQAVVVSAETSITIGVESPYIDIAGASGVVIQSTGILTNHQVTLQFDETIHEFTESQSVEISPKAATVDLCAVGGGGGGASGYANTSFRGGGGGGGYVTNLLSVDLTQNEKNIIRIAIGAGGAGGEGGRGGTTGIGNSGGTGGTTSIYLNENQILTANGGNGGTGGENGAGGTGNGNGGAANTDGSPATIRIFGESSQSLAGGGGGAGGSSTSTRKTGGAPNGGQGGAETGSTTPRDALNGDAPGGGGGGGGCYISSNYAGEGGAGGAGGAYARFGHDATATQNEEDSMSTEFTVNGKRGGYS